MIRLRALLLFCLISGPLAAQDTNSDSAQGDSVPSATVAVDDVVEDASIEARLSQIYQSSGWFSELAVTANNGIVTITGTSDSEEHSQWATSVARRTEDVVAVINKLHVEAVVDLSSSRDAVSKSLDTLWKDFIVRSPLFVAALVILVLTGILAKLVGWAVVRVFEQRKMRVSFKDLIYQLTSIALWIVGILVAVVVAFPGMTPSKALTLLGLGSVAIGFAFKDIFENFFAGI